MKAFKGKTYTVPVEKDRKEQGKYKEKIDHKTMSTRGKIAKKNEDYSSVRANPTYAKNKKLSFGDYILLFTIISLICLFIFLIISLVFFPNKSHSKDLVI